MRIHSLQHVPFEDIGSLLQDVRANGHILTSTHWYKGDLPPSLDTFDVLIVMGGPMGIYDDDVYPWLATEKQLIACAIAAGKKVMGICLGAQLIASVLGAKVTRNIHREIGWFPLQVNAAASSHPVAKILAECEKVFHWHGDTFALPAHATLIASSQACENQAYIIGNQIYGFQFHLETTETSASALIQHCAADLDGTTYVQSAQEIMQNKENFIAINKAMSAVFNQWLQ
jgi:GMP synthase-like glutamine amidotransferase